MVSEIQGLRFSAIPSAHLPADAPRVILDAAGESAFLGYVLDLGLIRLYHAGDSVVYEGLVERVGNVDLAVLPVNGRRWAPFQPLRRGNMTGEEAVDCAALLRARTLIPVHHELLGSGRSSLAPVIEYAARTQPELRINPLRPGEQLELLPRLAARHEDAVRRYFAACNAADPELFRRVLAPTVVHYFPPGAGGPYVGSEAVIDLWLEFVAEKGSVWTIDRLIASDEIVVTEWTHFKPHVHERIRGSEWYEFDDAGRIAAIWAHYASPRDATRPVNELEGFPYKQKAYPLGPPSVERRQTAASDADPVIK